MKHAFMKNSSYTSVNDEQDEVNKHHQNEALSYYQTAGLSPSII